MARIDIGMEETNRHSFDLVALDCLGERQVDAFNVDGGQLATVVAQAFEGDLKAQMAAAPRPRDSGSAGSKRS